MEDFTMNRRSVLRLVVLGGALTAGASALLSACGGTTCTDTSGITPDERAARTAAAYVDHSTNPAKSCGNCNFFVGVSANACGTCRILKGPFNPEGNCRLWAAKAT